MGAQPFLKIAVDVDGVLADLAGMLLMLKVYREATGVDLGREFIDEFWRKVPMTEREFFKMVARAWSRWDVIGLLEDDAAEDVEQLAALGCVDIIIPRQAKTVENVKR